MTLRPRDKVALGVVCVILVIVAYYFIFLGPQRSKVSSLNGEITSQLARLTQDQTAYSEGRAAEIALRMSRGQWKALQTAVPETANIPGLLRVLQRNSNAAHVSIQSVSLNGGSTAGTSTTAASTVGGAAAVPVSLTFGGTYQNLEHLMRKLNGLVRESGSHVHVTGPLVSIGSMTLSGQPKDLTADLTATIYELGTSGTAATATTEATP